MRLFLFILFAYLLGSVPSGIVAARILGLDDPRKSGSGNIGATNVGRLHGKKAGLVTLCGDAAKGFLPAVVAAYAFKSPWSAAAVALAAYAGHLFPVYLGFKGGKGVATGLGIFLALAPAQAVAAALVFAAVVRIWRMVSLASISAAAALPIIVLYFDGSAATVALALVVAAATIWKHQSNIERILSGTEARLGHEK